MQFKNLAFFALGAAATPILDERATTFQVKNFSSLHLPHRPESDTHFIVSGPGFDTFCQDLSPVDPFSSDLATVTNAKCGDKDVTFSVAYEDNLEHTWTFSVKAKGVYRVKSTHTNSFATAGGYKWDQLDLPFSFAMSED